VLEAQCCTDLIQKPWLLHFRCYMGTLKQLLIWNIISETIYILEYALYYTENEVIKQLFKV
jgi:hypothetical protein